MECITLGNSSTVPKQIINFLRQFAALFKACFQIKQLETRYTWRKLHCRSLCYLDANRSEGKNAWKLQKMKLNNTPVSIRKSQAPYGYPASEN